MSRKEGTLATSGEAQAVHELLERSPWGGEKPRPPSPVTEACPIINIAPTESPALERGELGRPWRTRECCLNAFLFAAAQMRGVGAIVSFVCPAHGEVLVAANVLIDPPATYEAPSLRELGRVPSVELHMVPSENRPGQLSMRRLPTDRTWWPVFEALNAAGFEAGDVVRVTLVRRGGQ